MKFTLNDKRNVIIGHYDELVKQITLYSEEILKKINASTLITELPRYPSYLGKTVTIDDTNEYGIEGLIDRYPKEFDLSGGNDENDSLDVGVHLGETKVTEYVRLIGERAIEEVRKAQHENLVRLDEWSKRTDEEMDVDDEDDEDDEDESDQNQNYIKDDMEELREKLFADKFAFFVMIEDVPNGLKLLTEGKENKFIFKMYVIVVDFYMSVGDIELLECFINESFMPSNNSLETTFNQKSLLVELLWKYICARVADYPKFGNEVIRVSKNKLLSLQGISFYHRELDLDKAIIKATERLDFSNLRSLQLIISDEKDAIHIKTLKGLFNLEYLHLRNTVFNPSLLKDLTKLRSLSLARYDCEDMNELFRNAPNLVSLYLCLFKNEPNFDFKPLPKLRYLNLTDRFISQKSLQKQLMTLNDEMKIIQLARCGITHKSAEVLFKEIMTKFRGLAKLEIEECNIQVMCKEWFDGMSQLRELNLSGDKLAAICSDDFENLKNLEVLNLECNKFKSLEANTFSCLKNLKSLCLSGNISLQEVHSDAFNGLDNLEELNLEEIGIFKRNDKVLKGDWLRFPNLRKLSLSFCLLKSIDSAVFINMPKLEELNLSSNKLDINANSFQNLPNLKGLNLAFNNLKKISPLVFSSLSSLEQLDLRSNCLTELKPEMFTGLDNLKKLELKSNQLKNFNNHVLENLKKLEEVLLD